MDLIPVGTQYQKDVVSTSMRRDHVASTLIRLHFNVVCPLGLYQCLSSLITLNRCIDKMNDFKQIYDVQRVTEKG